MLLSGRVRCVWEGVYSLARSSYFHSPHNVMFVFPQAHPTEAGCHHRRRLRG